MEEVFELDQESIDLLLGHHEPTPSLEDIAYALAQYPDVLPLMREQLVRAFQTNFYNAGPSERRKALSVAKAQTADSMIAATGHPAMVKLAQKPKPKPTEVESKQKEAVASADFSESKSSEHKDANTGEAGEAEAQTTKKTEQVAVSSKRAGLTRTPKVPFKFQIKMPPKLISKSATKAPVEASPPASDEAAVSVSKSLEKETQGDASEEKINCICGVNVDEGFQVRCDMCTNWFHGLCCLDCDCGRGYGCDRL